MKIVSEIDANGAEKLWIVFGARNRKEAAEKSICVICESEFVRKTKVWGREKTTTCGSLCSAALAAKKTRKRVLVNCSFCGVAHERLESIVGIFNYCSRDCQGKARRLDGGLEGARPEHYGTSKKRHPNKLGAFHRKEKKILKGIRTARGATAESHVDFQVPVPSGDRASHLRDRVLSFKGRVCQDCGQDFEPLLHVHHADGERTNNSDDNLLVLCALDHALRHMAKKMDLATGIEKWVYRSAELTPLDAIEPLRIMAMEALVEETKARKEKNVRQALPVDRVKGENPKAGECQYCGVVIRGPRSKAKKYCDLVCSAHASRNRIVLSCDFCGEAFEERGSREKQVNHFCTALCKYEAQKKASGFTALWPDGYGDSPEAKPYRSGAARKKAFAEKPRKCVDCSMAFEPLLVGHHIDGNGSNGDTRNIEVLCVLHHATRHLRRVGDEWVYSLTSLTPREALPDIVKMIADRDEKRRFSKLDQ